MSSKYVTLCSTIKADLTTALAASYAGIVVDTRLFKADRLPDLSGTNYAIIVSPPPVILEERKVSTRSIQLVYFVNLFLLVKNFDEVNALFGVTPGALGIAQLVEDVKTAIYTSINSGALNALLSESLSELGQKVQFDSSALPAFDSGEYPFVYRALQPFMGGEKNPTCY